MSDDEALFVSVYSDLARYFADVYNGRTDETDDLFLADADLPQPWRNIAILKHALSTPDDYQRVSRDLKSFYRRDDRFNLHALHDGDFAEHGFLRYWTNSLMIRPADAGAIEVPRIEALHIAEVSTADQLLAFEGVRNEAFGNDIDLTQHRPEFVMDMMTPKLRMWLASIDGESVATSGLFLSDHATMLKYVSTRPAFKRQGIGAAMSAFALAHAPNGPIVLDGNTSALRIYERLGFASVGPMNFWGFVPLP